MWFARGFVFASSALRAPPSSSFPPSSAFTRDHVFHPVVLSGALHSCASRFPLLRLPASRLRVGHRRLLFFARFNTRHPLHRQCPTDRSSHWNLARSHLSGDLLFHRPLKREDTDSRYPRSLLRATELTLGAVHVLAISGRDHLLAFLDLVPHPRQEVLLVEFSTWHPGHRHCVISMLLAFCVACPGFGPSRAGGHWCFAVLGVCSYTCPADLRSRAVSTHQYHRHGPLD